jgi:2-methylcitrate dehydratase PrpD
MSKTLNERFALAEVSFKPWCAARQTMGATQALRELVEASVAVTEGKIVAAVLPPHRKMIDHGVTAGDRASYVTSLPYQMAVVVLQPERMLELSPPHEPPSPALQSFMARIEVTADESLLADYPAAWPARVSVATSIGRHDQLVRQVPGDPTRALDETELKQKFDRLAVPVLGKEPADRLWRCGLEYSAPSLLAATTVLCDLVTTISA